MNYKKSILLATALAFCLAPAVYADVKARISTDTEPTPFNCELRWLPVDKKYNVVRRGAGGAVVEKQYTPDQILTKQVQPPAGWQKLEAEVRKNPAVSQVAALKKIANDYKMLQYDEEAGALIGRIYMQANQVQNALKEMNVIVTANRGSAVNSVMAPILWEAMIQANQTSRLPAMLDAAAQGDRRFAALAMNARGDLFMQNKEYKNALKDGYLRTIFMFADQGNARAEAFYKAAQAFDKVQQTVHAERMRKSLTDLYPNTKWARKLTSGE